MRHIALFLMLGILMLTACTAAPSPNQDQQATNTIAPSPTVPAAQMPTETQSPTVSSPAAGTIVFKIISGESKVFYEVNETFLNQNNRFNTAVGITPQISGEVYANLQNPPASSLSVIEVDISQFESDSSRRDDAIRQKWLESARFPIARFVPTKIEGLPESYTEGKEYSFRVTGELTVRDTTKPVTFDVRASLANQTLTGNATTTILMSDFGIGPISIAGILQTEDIVKVTLQFVARP